MRKVVRVGEGLGQRHDPGERAVDVDRIGRHARDDACHAQRDVPEGTGRRHDCSP